MKNVFGFLLFCFFNGTCFAQQGQSEGISIIPAPAKIVAGAGHFPLPENIVISAPNENGMKQIISVLSDRLSVPTGNTVSVKVADPDASVQLVLNQKADHVIGTEGYHLSVTPATVTITANTPAGLFYGVQTLLQLFPKEIEGLSAAHNVVWEAPCVEITDYPRFGWRGLMFDVSRHFFSKPEVEKFIDQMVRYKYNLLHLHLTDDEGWRIEIKSLPKLTEIGAWSVKRIGYFGTFPVPKPDEPRKYGGFFTQDDMREIIRYAQDRFVNILPEIDVPGHSLAAVTAYPDLSCSGAVKNVGVGSGEEIKDWDNHTALFDDNLCPANENVYVFLDKVITEVAELFPFEYIHMGGDETFKTFWQSSDAVRDLMKREKLKNMDEVQSYFEKRVEKIVESKGKKFMGWDEVLDAGLAPSAAVMNWQGMDGGIKAAKMEHEVVMCPSAFTYLDYMQGDSAIEPRVYSTLRLKNAYEFEPLPNGVDPKFIKGGQANLWTEQVYNMRHEEYMVWPRALAIAEDLWSSKEKKNWSDFSRRVELHFGRMDVAGIKYAPSLYDPIVNASMQDDTITVALTTEIDGLDIYYSFDNSFPDNFYPKYTSPVVVPDYAVQLKLITYRNGQPIGRMMTIPVAELKNIANKKH